MPVVNEEPADMSSFIDELADTPADGMPRSTIVIDAAKANPLEILELYPHSHELYNFLKEVD